MQQTQVGSLCWEDPWRREWLPAPVFLPGESHGQRSLVGYSPWGHKQWGTTEPLTLSLSPLYQICGLQIFSTFPQVALSFLKIVSIAVQKLFNLMQYHLFNFAFVVSAFCVVSKKIIVKTNDKTLFPCVFFQKFFSITKSIFVSGVRQDPSSFLCMWLSGFPGISC